MGQVVGAGELLRNDHAPCVDDELAGFGRLQRGEVGVNPVKSHVGLRRQPELARIAATRAARSSFGKANPSRSRRARTPRRPSADAELQPSAHEHLVRALQLRAQGLHRHRTHRHPRSPCREPYQPYAMSFPVSRSHNALTACLPARESSGPRGPLPCCCVNVPTACEIANVRPPSRDRRAPVGSPIAMRSVTTIRGRRAAPTT